MLASRNYPPSPDLTPYIARHYVFSADLPDSFELTDILMAETAFVRILIRGDWAGEIAPGEWHNAGPVILFGPNSRPMPVRVRGAFTVAGFAIRPSGWQALFANKASNLADTMVNLREEWDSSDRLWEDVQGCSDDAQIVVAMEKAIHHQLVQIGTYQSDPLMQNLEKVAQSDSTRSIDSLARESGLSIRQFERRCFACFGMTPKMVMRRSRFLDMAAAMRGYSDPSESELASLRYFDESHLNREFRRFAGRTPKQFKNGMTPLLDNGLKLRAEANERFRKSSVR